MYMQAIVMVMRLLGSTHWPGQGPDNLVWESPKRLGPQFKGHVTSKLFRPVNQILKSNKKTHHLSFKVVTGVKSILYLMPQHTQACVFIKKMVLFHLRLLEMVDQDREPSEKLGPQIQEQVWPGHEDQVVLAPDQVLVLRTQSWSGSPKRIPSQVVELEPYNRVYTDSVEPYFRALFSRGRGRRTYILGSLIKSIFLYLFIKVIYQNICQRIH